jgi:enterochelin esterase-like enzyme
MGGYAALHLGMAYTDLFSRIGGHSPAAILKGDTRPDIWRLLYSTDEDKQNRNPMMLAESADLLGTAIYLDCGVKDRLSRGTELLYNKLKEKDVQVEYHAYPGDHNTEYWKSHVEEYLLFYGAD